MSKLIDLQKILIEAFPSEWVVAPGDVVRATVSPDLRIEVTLRSPVIEIEAVYLNETYRSLAIDVAEVTDFVRDVLGRAFSDPLDSWNDGNFDDVAASLPHLSKWALDLAIARFKVEEHNLLERAESHEELAAKARKRHLAVQKILAGRPS